MIACGNRNTFDATGTFEAVTVTISAQSTGRIVSFNAGEGDKLNAGDAVCSIDSTALLLQRNTLLQQQKALLASKPDQARQLAALKEQIAKQHKEISRLQALTADNAVPLKQLEDAQSNLAILQSQYDAMLSSLSKSSASIDGNVAVITTQLDQVDYNIDQCNVTTPVAGTVLAQYARTGEFVSAGKPLVKIADTDNMYMRAYVTSDQLSAITIGRKVKVWADFGADERYPYEGTVTWIASESEFTPKNIQTKNSRANLVYSVKIAVKGDDRLKIGLYGEVEF